MLRFKPLNKEKEIAKNILNNGFYFVSWKEPITKLTYPDSFWYIINLDCSVPYVVEMYMRLYDARQNTKTSSPSKFLPGSWVSRAKRCGIPVARTLKINNLVKMLFCGRSSLFSRRPKDKQSGPSSPEIFKLLLFIYLFVYFVILILS